MVGVLGKAEQTEADDGGDALDPRNPVQGVFDRLRGLGSALQRRALRQLQGHERVALILCRQEAARQVAAEEVGRAADDQQQDDGDARLAH